MGGVARWEGLRGRVGSLWEGSDFGGGYELCPHWRLGVFLFLLIPFQVLRFLRDCSQSAIYTPNHDDTPRHIPLSV